ncbi:Ama1 protein [Diplonema papillatum]|nr:Ama1 protein [Diplonema papillatum]
MAEELRGDQQMVPSTAQPAAAPAEKYAPPTVPDVVDGMCLVEEPVEGVLHDPQTAEVSEWAVGLWGCCDDMGLCMDAMFCTWCMHGRIIDAAVHKKPDSMNVAVVCGLFGACVWSLLCSAGGLLAVNGLFAYQARSVIQRDFTIRRNLCSDLCGSWCCTVCVLIQHHRELTNQGIDPGYTCCKPRRTHVGLPPVVVAHVAQPGYIVA